jgi:carbon monoxide dehydrogenase subunit G
MIVNGERAIAAPIGQTLAALADPRAVGEASGAVADFDQVDGNTVRVRLVPQLNLGAPVMTLEIRATWEAERHLEIVGKGGNGEHVMQLRGEVEVSEAAEHTLVRWRGELTVMGVLAAVGQRAPPWIVRDQVDAALDAVESVAMHA